MSSTNIPAPPRPRAVNEPAVNQRPVNEPRTVTIRFRWHTLLTVVAAFIIGVAVGISLWTAVMIPAVNEQSLPPCTDAIAEAGGMCQGPLIDE